MSVSQADEVFTEHGYSVVFFLGLTSKLARIGSSWQYRYRETDLGSEDLVLVSLPIPNSGPVLNTKSRNATELLHIIGHQHQP